MPTKYTSLRRRNLPIASRSPTEIVSTSDPYPGQRINSDRLKLRGQGLQDFKEYQHIGNLARSHADCREPFSLPFDLQVAARKFGLANLCYGDGISLPKNSRSGKP